MSNIRTDPPDSDAYRLAYANGWIVGVRATEGALERADARGVSHAWYDGYMDAATGRPRWTYRYWRRNGCDATCGYDCNGPHRTPPPGASLGTVTDAAQRLDTDAAGVFERAARGELVLFRARDADPWSVHTV